MMNTVLSRLAKQLDRKAIELDVDEELRFHFEMVRSEYVRQGLSRSEAKAKTLKRFGDLERFKQECVQIRRRGRPVQRLLKVSLVLLGVLGLLVIVLSTDVYVSRVGHTLIYVAVSGRLLLYARSWRPPTFLPANKRSHLSLFTDKPPSPLSS